MHEVPSPGHLEGSKDGAIDILQLLGELDRPEVVQDEEALDGVDESEAEVPGEHVWGTQHHPGPRGQQQKACSTQQRSVDSLQTTHQLVSMYQCSVHQ